MSAIPTPPITAIPTNNAIRAENTYDKHDIVRRESVLTAGNLKMAAYRLRDPETGEFSKLQFHATYANTVLAVMDEESAKLFVTFVGMTLPDPEAKPELVATLEDRKS